MPEASVHVPVKIDSTSAMARAEAAIGEMGDAPEVDLANEPAHPEPEEDIFGLNEPDAEEGEEVPEGDELEAPDASPRLGSEAQPFTVKNLPNAFVTLKIDGEEKTIPIREMTEGYMREQAFHKRINDVKGLADQAKQAAESFKVESDKFRASFRQLVTNPDELFDFLDEHSSQVLDAVARKQLARMMEWQKDPNKRLQHERAAHEARLAKERKRLDDDRTAYQTTRQQEEAHQRYVQAFKPGYDAGMKKAGYPKITDEFRTTVNGLLNARKQLTGQELTAKDIEDAVVRAAKVTAAETVAARKPAPPPVSLVPAGKRPPPARAAQAAPKSFTKMFRDLGK